MMTILVFLCSILLLTFLIRAGLKLMGKVAGHHVHKRHQALEYILNTGQIPPEWIIAIKHSLRFSIISPHPLRYKKLAIQRLDDLIKEMKQSPLVDEESTRLYILEELQKNRSSWESGTWNQISSADDTDLKEEGRV